MPNDTPTVPDVTVASFRLTQNGLVPLGSPTFAQWLACGRFIKNAEQSVQFWVGDWLLYGERVFGKTDYEQAALQTGLANQTLRIYKHVASALPLSLRRNKLSFHHHKEVASLPPETQGLLLRQAEEAGWPLFKLRQEKNRLRLESVRPASSPTQTYGLHVGDPELLLTKFPDASIDLVLTAPAPGVADPAALERLLPYLVQKLKENSHLYIFTDWQEYPALMPVVERYLTVKNLLVWEDRMLPAENTPYRHVYGFVLFAHKGRRHLNGRRDASLLPVPVAEYAASAGQADKPLALLSYLIEKSSLPGEVICDPLMGTGAVCLVAKRTGRRYIGIERDKALYDIARSRLT